ncbi:MAG TPA: winged helix-turn-helix domain-containing protein [Steroidobacteraceae bacterium]|nr:winged helix-turn-helix domain-containing protein [Steroidobacteraceae bacterium]
MSGTNPEPGGYRVGDVFIDVGTRQVSRDGSLLQLPPLSFDLLLALVRRAPNAVSSGELMEKVWTGRVVNDETIAKRVELVREALGDDSRQSRYIALVRGHGYRITADVEPITRPTPATVAAPAMRKRAWPIAIAVVLAAVVIAVMVLRDGAPASRSVATDSVVPQRIALAVLPLDDLSTGNTEEYFAAGMHDALITDLSRASAIKVISRTSTLPYRDTGKSLSTIAGELGVDLVMEGSVLRADDRVRITVQLLDSDDNHLWAEQYEGDVRDVLNLQSRVARAVAEAVKVKLSPLEHSRMASTRPINVESYDLYLKGMQLLEKSPAEFEAGIGLLQKATEIDPANALAYARLASAYARRAHAPGAAKSLYPRATAYALQAVGLDENLAEAHQALAEMRLYFHWDWPAAEQSFRKVFELNPNAAATHAHYGWFRMLHDDWPGAIAEAKLAAELDPNDPLWGCWHAWLYLLHDEYAPAETELRRVLDAHADYPCANHVLGQTLIRLGRHEEALAAFQKAADASPRWSWGLPQGLALVGRKDEARVLAERLERAEFPDAWGLAEVYTALGDHERALKWVEYGYEIRRDWIPWVKANTFLAPLRTEPRFKEVLRRLDLPT